MKSAYSFPKNPTTSLAVKLVSPTE